MDFDILIDSTLLELQINSDLSPIENKHLLSIVDDLKIGDVPRFSEIVSNAIVKTMVRPLFPSSRR
jgi:hypothetical protein